jgi:FemAB-related protein (PEP-CTERM system-associated)
MRLGYLSVLKRPRFGLFLMSPASPGERRLSMMASYEPDTAPSQIEPAQVNVPPVRVVPFQETDVAAWEQFVLFHPKATFFHQLGWKRVMEKTYGYQPYYLCARRGERLTGIAPSFLISSWMTGRCLISLPFAVYGGICAEDDESERMLLRYMERAAADLDVEYLELRSRTGEVLPGYHANLRYATFTIPLVRDTEVLYKNLPKDIRYMIRKAEKAGLSVRHGFDQLDTFYRLMTINLRRLGTPAFPRSLFENLIREYPGNTDLTVVYLNDEPLAGGLSFFFREWMQPYYIGSAEKAKALAANDFLWWELIKFAAKTGFSTFDFGRSKKDSGNFDFKKKWNPRMESLPYQVRLVRRRELPNFSPTNPKFEMATNVWKKLPLGLTRMIGPHVVRWFP